MTFFRLLPRILTIGLFLLCTVAWSREEADLQEVLVKANAKQESGDPKGAIEDYTWIIKQDPKTLTPRLMRAVAKWSLGDVEGAMADINEAIALKDDYADAYRLRATIEFAQHDYYQAQLDIDKATTLQPDFPTGHVLRAEIMYAQGGAEAALPHLDRAIELAPRLSKAIYMRAGVHEELGNARSALADYNRALEIAPGLVEGYLKRGWFRFFQKDWAGAIEDGEKHLAMSEPNAETLRLMGGARLAQGDHAAALVTLTQAAGLEVTDEESVAYTLILRQLALWGTGGADDRLTKAVAGWSEGSWWQTIGRFMAGQLTEEELDETMGPLEIDLENRGRHCEANYYIGMKRLKAGDRSAARLRFEACIAAGRPDFVEHTLAQEELKKFKKR